MVKLNSPARFFSIKTNIILSQTDTTVGFLSQDAPKLCAVKSRPNTKPFIVVYKNFQALKKDHKRVPNTQKNRVRRLKKTTFIVKNHAFRVAEDVADSSCLRQKEWTYSTSANESGKNFSRTFCEQKADIIIENKKGLFEGQASKLYKINHKKIKRLR
ncbi:MULTISPECIES: Sua5/YciO/YrdC/YwlC family protein [Sulfurimonas]|uniref:Sua5/YciO/YrdC/YwlC family protein n=1 Tax=Sulfurimonas TaxID=202746 RepID=UPI00125EE87D|nr:Sua5/YciO/YrdC/YwlC family protein [Sulfurimonas hydrogeniphila]